MKYGAVDTIYNVVYEKDAPTVETDTVTKTVHYVDVDGNTLADDYTDSASFEKTTDAVTGESTYTPKDAALGSQANPAIEGYHVVTDPAEATSAQTVKYGAADTTYTVVYEKDAPDTDNNGSGTETPGGTTDNNGSGTDNNGGTTDNNGSGTDNNGGTTDNNGSGTDNNGGTTDNNGSGTDNNGGTTDNGSGTDNNGGTTDNNGSGTDNNGDTIANNGLDTDSTGSATENTSDTDNGRVTTPVATVVQANQTATVTAQAATVKTATAAQTTLPQTGEHTDNGALIVGSLAVLGSITLLGATQLRKRHDGTYEL